jgi:RND family efflux transporter MFP subunit
MHTASGGPQPARPATAAWATILAVLLPALLAACGRPEPAPEPVRAVRTMVVSSQAAGGEREFAGEVRARVESRLGFRVAGKMTSRSAELGRHVNAGDTLALLDATDLKLSQDSAQAAVRAAQTNFELAAAEYRRYKDLRDQGFISSIELERREATLKAQKALLEQAQSQASAQGNQAGYAVLTATAAGVITAIEADAGTVLGAGTPVVRLAHDGPRDAVFAVPEDGAAAMRALIGRSGALKVRSWGNTAAMPATVREVAGSADPTTRTFLVKADVGAAPLQLGQTVTVLVDLPRREGIARLPLAAVMQQQGKTAVWLLDPATMTVKVQPIAVAGADGNTVVVAGGLVPGQTVVTAGVHVLTQGQKVRYFDAGAAGLAPAQASAASR